MDKIIMKHPRTLIEKHKAIQKIGSAVAVPWHTLRVFNVKELGLFGDQVVLDKDGDYVSITEAQQAVGWFVEQLGGKVSWTDSK